MIAAALAMVGGLSFMSGAWAFRGWVEEPAVVVVALVSGLAVFLTGLALATVRVEWGVEDVQQPRQTGLDSGAASR